MDQLLVGLIKSDTEEKMKSLLMREKFAPAGANNHKEGDVMKMLAVCWDAILQGMTRCETEYCKEVYLCWAKNNIQAFQTFFDESKIDVSLISNL